MEFKEAKKLHLKEHKKIRLKKWKGHLAIMPDLMHKNVSHVLLWEVCAMHHSNPQFYCDKGANDERLYEIIGTISVGSCDETIDAVRTTIFGYFHPASYVFGVNLCKLENFDLSNEEWEIA